MPYLMLAFEASQEADDYYDYDIQMMGVGRDLIKGPTRHQIKLTMIDTDNGKVVEIEADATRVTTSERSPSFGELGEAKKTLGRDVRDKKIEKQLEETGREKAHLLKKSGELLLENKQLRKKIKDRGYDDLDRELIGAALDNYMDYLSETNQWDTYDEAKALYKHFTGQEVVATMDEEQGA